MKLSPELRPRLYELLMPMLGSAEDLVVRLAAAKAMKVVIDDFEFSVEELDPYLEQVFSLLFSLLKEVCECDTKLNVLNVLSYLIERVGVSIRPICSALLHYLPILWEESASHNMLRCSILSTLVFIVQVSLQSVGWFKGLLDARLDNLENPDYDILLEHLQTMVYTGSWYSERGFAAFPWTSTGAEHRPGPGLPHLPAGGRTGAVADPPPQHRQAVRHTDSAPASYPAPFAAGQREPSYHHLHPTGNSKKSLR